MEEKDNEALYVHLGILAFGLFILILLGCSRKYVSKKEWKAIQNDMKIEQQK
tara:strand:+ start:461 stop:616 length:156 start_codon:yes stop_codon:yes gene_type:complete